jgi:hypothetical protein
MQNHGLSFNGISEGGSEKQGKIEAQLLQYTLYIIMIFYRYRFKAPRGHRHVKDFDPLGCKADTGVIFEALQLERLHICVERG